MKAQVICCIIVALLAAMPTADGTTIEMEKKKCSVCGKKVEQRNVTSTYNSGSMDLDTRPPELERSTLFCGVHCCPRCGYCSASVADKIAGAKDIIAIDEYKAIAKDERLPELARNFMCASFLYEKAGRITEAGWLALSAAWACDDDMNPDTTCRIKAAAMFRAAAASNQTYGPDRNSERALLIDILRRMARYDEALGLCDSALVEADSGIVRQVLEFQRKLIGVKDNQPHTVAEAQSGP